jgi:hypothetical protein
MIGGSSNSGIGWGLIGAGSACLVNFFFNCIVHTHSCWAIQHYIPEQAFENNIGRLNMENKRLTEENVQLKTNVDRLERIAEDQKKYADRQVQITGNLREMFAANEEALGKKTLELGDITGRFEELQQKAAVAKEHFDKSIAEAKQVVQSLREANQRLREILKNENILSGDYDDMGDEWDKDIGILSGENDEYKEQNLELKRMMDEAKREFAMAIKLREDIQASGKDLGAHVREIHELTQKLQEAHKKIDETQKLSQELQQCKEELQEYKEINKLYQQFIEFVRNESTDEKIKTAASQLLKQIEDITESHRAGPLSENLITEEDFSEVD